MFRVKIIPKTQRAKNRVNEHGEIMQVLREDTPQCTNGQKAIFCESEDSTRWQGWFTFDEVDIEKLPPQPMTQQAKEVTEKWKSQIRAENAQKRFAHELTMQKAKMKKNKKNKKKGRK